jgi:ribosomal protein L37AE/L43A
MWNDREIKRLNELKDTISVLTDGKSNIVDLETGHVNVSEFLKVIKSQTDQIDNFIEKLTFCDCEDRQDQHKDEKSGDWICGDCDRIIKGKLYRAKHESIKLSELISDINDGKVDGDVVFISESSGKKYIFIYDNFKYLCDDFGRNRVLDHLSDIDFMVSNALYKLIKN